jgi:hypothetical protein
MTTQPLRSVRMRHRAACPLRGIHPKAGGFAHSAPRPGGPFPMPVRDYGDLSRIALEADPSCAAGSWALTDTRRHDGAVYRGNY